MVLIVKSVLHSLMIDLGLLPLILMQMNVYVSIFFFFKFWSPLKNLNFKFKACDCSGLSEECVFNETLYQETGHGGFCINCRQNTEGAKCENCKYSFYRPADENCSAFIKET